MSKGTHQSWTMVACILGASAGVPACLGASDSPAETPYFNADGTNLTQHQIPSFEAFRDKARVHGVDFELYQAEGDLPFYSEADLKAYYDQFVAGDQNKSAVHEYLNPNSLTFMWSRWTHHEQLGMKYCVSDDFGAGQANMNAGMAGAVHNWQRLANMWYQYDPTANASCRDSDPLPAGYGFKVSPWSVGNAQSFFPYDGARQVYYTLANAATDSLANVIKVLTHEMGHTLGLAHENHRSDYATGNCVESQMYFLTPFDPNSIMEGGGTDASGNPCPRPSDPSAPSLLDGVGLRILYGPQPAYYMPLWSMR